MVKVIAFHLLNDYSGSPKVLFQLLSGLSYMGYNIKVVTSKGGILDLKNQDTIKIHHFYYRFHKCNFFTILLFIYAQLACLYNGLRYGHKRIFYINTILPIGGAIAGRILKSPIIYHYHENAEAKGIIYKLLSKLMLRFADKIICVSKSQASTLPASEKIVIIPNAISKSFEDIDNFDVFLSSFLMPP